MSENVIEGAYAHLRGHTTADIRFDEHFRPIKYVIGPDGRLVAPVMVAMLSAVDVVLFVPEYAEGALELQVTPEPFDERGEFGALADRWRIYHGEPEDVRWALFNIDAARFGELVIDGLALTVANPLFADEARICRQMNQDRADDLRRLCMRFSPSQMEIEKPVMVGIDPLGIDVRARFEVVRVPAIERMNSADQAQRILSAMIQTAKQGV